jgi:hypothetical protein
MKLQNPRSFIESDSKPGLKSIEVADSLIIDRSEGQQVSCFKIAFTKVWNIINK